MNNLKKTIEESRERLYKSPYITFETDMGKEQLKSHEKQILKAVLEMVEERVKELKKDVKHLEKDFKQATIKEEKIYLSEQISPLNKTVYELEAIKTKLNKLINKG